MISFTPRPALTLGEAPQDPLDKRLSGPQSLSGRDGKDRISPAEKRTPAVQPVAQFYGVYALIIKL